MRGAFFPPLPDTGAQDRGRDGAAAFGVRVTWVPATPMSLSVPICNTGTVTPILEGGIKLMLAASSPRADTLHSAL